MTCGSVDDGKSTLLGKLFYETGNIFSDQADLVKAYHNQEILNLK